MKNLSLKITLAVLTFFIGVGIVSLWYFTRTKPMSDEDLTKIVLDTKFVVENPCDYPQPQSRDIDGDEVIYLAECFVIQNGYTDLPPTDDKSKLVEENVWGGIDEEDMKMRHDSLERRAFSYYNSEIYGGSWVVMFRFKPHPDIVKFYGDGLNYIGRAVVIDYSGKDLRIQHSPYPLRMPEPKIINP